MIIFLDTNVFYNYWFLRNANFKYLFHFLNNELNILYLSELVLEEAGNIRNRELEEALADIKRSIRKIQKLNRSKVNFDKQTLGIEEYHLLPVLEEMVEYIVKISYDKISHSEVVQRALINKKPFLEMAMNKTQHNLM